MILETTGQAMDIGVLIYAVLLPLTVEPPKANTPKSGQPPRGGQNACPLLLLPLN